MPGVMGSGSSSSSGAPWASMAGPRPISTVLIPEREVRLPVSRALPRRRLRRCDRRRRRESALELRLRLRLRLRLEALPLLLRLRRRRCRR